MKDQKKQNSQISSSVETVGVCSYIPFGPIKQRNVNHEHKETEKFDPLCLQDVNDAERSFIDKYLCSICNHLLLKATRLPCNHMYCYYCIQKSIIRKPRCPLCRSLIVSYIVDANVNEEIEAFVADRPDLQTFRKAFAASRSNDPQLLHLTVPANAQCKNSLESSDRPVSDVHESNESMSNKPTPENTEFEARTSIFCNHSVSEDDSESSFTYDSSVIESEEDSASSDDADDFEMDATLPGGRAIRINIQHGTVTDN